MKPVPQPSRSLPLLARRAATAAVAALALPVGVLVALQTPWGMRTAARVALALANPWPDADLTVGGARGGFLTGIELHDLRLRARSGPLAVRVDTLRVRYRPGELLARSRRVREILVSGPGLVVTRQAGGPPDLLEPFSGPSRGDSSGGGFALDRLEIRRGSLELRTPRLGRDSVAIAEAIAIRLRDLSVKGTVTLALDTLAATLRAPATQIAPVQITAAGGLGPDRVIVRGIQVRGGRTRIAGGGRLPAPAAWRSGFGNTDFHLSARPLASEDIAAFVPALGKAGDLALELEARSEGASLRSKLEARSARGAHASLEALLSPPGGPVRIRTRGRIAGLDVGAILGRSETLVVNADWDADLDGPDAARITGPFTLGLDGSRAGRIRLERAAIAGAFQEGAATIDVRASSSGFGLSAKAIVSPFDTIPPYDVTATLLVPSLPPAAPAPRTANRAGASRPPPVLYSGGVRFAARGRGIVPRTATGELRLDLEPAPGVLIGPGTVRASWSRGQARWDLGVAAAGGAARAEGDLGLVPPFSYGLRNGEVTGVRPAAFANDTAGSRLDARFRIEGEGLTVDSTRGRAEITSLDLRYGHHRAEGVAVTLSLGDGRLALRAGGRLDGASLETDGSLAPVRAPREAQLEVRFRNLDLARATGDTVLASDLAGTLRANLASRDLMGLWSRWWGAEGPGDRHAVESSRGSARLRLDAGRIGAHHLSEAHAEGRLDRGRITLGARLESSIARARIEGEARPFEPLPSARVGRATFEGLDLRALMGAAAPRTDLHGSFTFGIAGRDARTMEGDLRLAMDGSRVNRAVLDRLSARIALAHGRLEVHAAARAGGDSLEVEAGGEPFADPVRFETRGAARFADLGALTGRDSLPVAAGVEFEARASIPRSGNTRALDLAGRLRGRARAGEARLDTLLAEAEYRDGLLRVPRLSLRGNVATVEGAGRIALYRGGADSTSFRLEAALGDLSPLAPLLGLRDLAAGGGRLSLSARGRPGAARFRGGLAIHRAHMNEIWADSVTATFTGRLSDTQLAGLDAEVAARTLVLWPFRERDLDATLRWDGRRLAADARSRLPGRRTQSLAFEIEPVPDGLRGRLERLELRHPGWHITLREPAEFEAGKRLHVEHLALLENDVVRISAHGGIEPDGTADFAFEVDSLDVSDFTDLLGMGALTGRVSAAGTLTGTRARPTLDCSVRSQLKPGRRRAARIAARLHWADELDLEASFRQKGEEGLGLSARGPFPLSLSRERAQRTPPAGASMSARLEATRFDLAWFEPLVPPHQARRIAGKLDGAVEAKGDPARPELSGSLALSGGGVELPALGVRFGEGEAALNLAGTVVRLERAMLESAGGRLSATGALTFLGAGRRSLDLEATLDRFVAMNNQQAKAAVSGEIRLTGDPRAAVARGGLVLVNSSIYAEGGTAQAEEVALTANDRLELQERFGIGVDDRPAESHALLDSADADLTLKIGDNVWIRRNTDPVVSLELEGEIRVRKPRGGALDVRGDVRGRTGRSFLSFVGRRFDITRVETELNGPIDSASVQMEARYNPESSGGARVTALVNADAHGITTDLRSEPHMDQAALLKYLATGQVQGELQSGTAYGLAAGAALGAVGGVAGRSLGLDVVQVTMDAYGGQVLSAGSYVDPRVYLGFRQPVVQGETSRTGFTSGSNPTEFEIEFEARRSLLFNVQGNSSRYRFLLRPRLGR